LSLASSKFSEALLHHFDSYGTFGVHDIKVTRYDIKQDKDKI
jgi:hypothetical protein